MIRDDPHKLHDARPDPENPFDHIDWERCRRRVPDTTPPPYASIDPVDPDLRPSSMILD